MNIKIKKIINYTIILFLIPALVITSAILINGNRYDIVMSLIAVLAVIPIFIKYEKAKINVKEMVVLAVMIALSVSGRMLFSAVPSFKPVTAMVVITGIYLGAEAGFLTGSLTALISNFFFGQGPWTPFQMLVWGLIGFLAGVLAKYIIKNVVTIIICGVVSGILFSVIMDLWSTLWLYGYFDISLYITQLTLSLPNTVIYAVSNVIFLLVLQKPIGKKISRIKIKYGI